MNGVNGKTAIEVAISFIDYFKVEEMFEKYDEWKNDKAAIRGKVDKLQTNLTAGGLSREVRKKKVAERDRLLKKILVDDPRLFPKTKYDSWILDKLKVPEDELDAARGTVAGKLEAANKDVDAFKAEGLPPFQLVRKHSGSRDHYKIMDFKDFAIRALRTVSTKEESKAGRQQKEFDRILITVKEHYGEVPAEMEAAAQDVKRAFDFKRRMASVLEDMVQDSMKVIEAQTMKQVTDEKFNDLAADLVNADEQAAN